MRELALGAMVAALIAASWGCGGSQADPEPATTTSSSSSEAPPPRYREPEEPSGRERMIWIVFWDEIHVLTVYPQPGRVVSEEPNNANAVFSSRNPHFSVISSYWEKEDDFAPVITAATSLDDLLARLEAMEKVRVEQQVNPVYAN